MNLPPRLVVADDQVLFREALVSLLSLDGFDVVGEATDGTEALRLVCELHPDVALLDVQMNGLSAGELVTSILEQTYDTRVVFLSMHSPTDLVSELEELGASGYFVKTIGRRSLAAGLHAVLTSPGMVTLVPRPVDARKAKALKFSPREQEVLRLMAKSRSNREIAGELYISEATVKRHITTIYSRLGVRSRVEALSAAIKIGLIGGLE